MEMQFAKRLRDARRAKALSTAGLASALTVDAAIIKSWESGESLPEIKQLITLSQTLGVSVDSLLTGKREKQQRVLVGPQISVAAYGRIVKKGVIDTLNEDYLPNGWKVVQTQLFVSSDGEDQIFVVLEK